MVNPRDGEKVRVIVLQDGEVVDVTTTNEKGYKKSLESGELWTLHDDTGRLLPYKEGITLRRLHQGESWVEASYGSSGTCGSATLPVFESETASESDVIQELETLLKSRFTERPEGSYTTHLFNSGAEKIRKKTGEEAVELILAQTREDMVYEAADLIYHLLVLLVSEKISFAEIIEELSKRH